MSYQYNKSESVQAYFHPTGIDNYSNYQGEREEYMSLNSNLTVVDLFCGAGGFSYGFAKAGFEIVAGLDNYSDALETFSYNHSTSQALHMDLSCPDDRINDFIGVDLVIGGPPCQGFSIAGKRLANDPRNFLTQSYLEMVKKLSPSGVVIENVPNILSLDNGSFANKIIRGLEDLGYFVEVHKLNAVDFGVPQNRKRVFFIGSKEKFVIAPFLEEKKSSKHITTHEAISDLPMLGNTLGEETTEYKKGTNNSYQKLMRNGSCKIYNHTAVDHKDRTKEIIAQVPDGGNYKDLPSHLQNTRRVNIAWTRMNSKKPSFTIDAGHNHHFHYKANRVPTVRECARIQSFPDKFLFRGNRTSQYRQVGNAVPPILAQKIAELLIAAKEV